MYQLVRIGFIVLFSMIILSFAQAQQRAWCGTTTEPSKWTEDYLQNRSAYPKSNEVLYVPLTIHLVGTDAGTGHLAVKTLLDAICKLNEDYASSNIQFYIFGNIRYINRTSLYEDKGQIYGRSTHTQNRVINTVNIYVVENAGEEDESVTLGYATGIGGDGLVIIKSEVNRTSTTLPHEIGHVLGLYHTFYGWEGYEHNYTLNAPTVVNSNRKVERVDGTNCTGSGDGFCDTGPDYLSNGPWACDRTGQSTTAQKDPAGSSFRSDGSNFMSYSSTACQSGFSGDQSQAMRTHLTSAKRNMLNRTAPLPVVDNIPVTLVSPLNSVPVNFSAINIRWNAVPGATTYLLEVSRVASFAGSFTTSYLLTSNETTLTDLAAGRAYFWRVKAFNAFSFCGNSSSVGKFQATSTTPVTEIEGNGTFNIYPNLLSPNQTVTIEANLIESTRLNIRLFDTSGRLLQSNEYEAIAGENTLRFNPNNISKGIYILNITTNRGTLVERLVIQ